MTYAGRTIVVTGCSSGIGAAVARSLLEQGAKVHGLDLRPPDLSLAGFAAIDLGRSEEIAGAFEALDRIDALFNCAGLAPTRPPLDILRVNFLGTRELTERLANRMTAGGAIVSLSSNGGLAWRERLPTIRDFLDAPGFDGGLAWAERHLAEIGNAYRFAKEALTVWTMRESARLIRRGIRINCTSPGAVSTPMLAEIAATVPAAAIDATTVPIGRRSSPEEQAAALLFLNSDAAAYVNGVDLPVDGGFAATIAAR